MAFLACLTAGGGIPLFVRTKGDIPQLAQQYTTIAALNGVHIFSEGETTELHSNITAGTKVYWQCYHNSIKLILGMTDSELYSDYHASNLLNYAFNSMVLLLGLDELENPNVNVEGLKKDLKCCYGMVDMLLARMELFGPIVGAVDVITSLIDHTTLQDCLDGFTESVQSNYGCLYVEQNITVATNSWWDLSTVEKCVLSMLLHSLPPATLYEVPVYLPVVSSRTAHRLLVFQLMDTVRVAVLCNPEPTLEQASLYVEKFWSIVMNTLEELSHSLPRNLPLNVTLEPSILSFIVIDGENQKCSSSFHSSKTGTSQRSLLSPGYQGTMGVAEQKDALLHFYRSTVGSLFPAISATPTSCTGLVHQPVETYSVHEAYKCYGLREDGISLFVLFNDTCPTYALGRLTHNLLQELTANTSLFKKPV